MIQTCAREGGVRDCRVPEWCAPCGCQLSGVRIIHSANGVSQSPYADLRIELPRGVDLLCPVWANDCTVVMRFERTGGGYGGSGDII